MVKYENKNGGQYSYHDRYMVYIGQINADCFTYDVFDKEELKEIVKGRSKSAEEAKSIIDYIIGIRSDSKRPD